MKRTARTFSFEYLIPTADGGEKTIIVEAKVYPGSPASGPRGERHTQPPEDPSIEILSTEEGGLNYEANDVELEEMQDAAWEHIPDNDDERH